MGMAAYSERKPSRTPRAAARSRRAPSLSRVSSRRRKWSPAPCSEIVIRFRKGAGAEGGQNRVVTGAVLLAHPSQVLLVVALVQEPGQHVLVQGGHRAGIEIQLPAVLLQQAGRQHHESHPHGGGDGLGEGVHVYHPPGGVDTLEGGNGTACKAELAVIVILDDDASSLLSPAQQGLPPADGCHQSGGIVVGGREMDHTGSRRLQGLRGNALAVQGHRAASRAALAVHLADFGIARILHGKDGLPSQQLSQQQIQVLRPGPHHDLLRRHGHALILPQVPGDGLPQGGQPLVGHWAQQGFPVLGQHLPGQTGPGRRGEAAGVHLVALQIQPPDRGLRRRLRSRRSGDGRPGPLHLRHKKAPFGLGVHIALRLQLLVGPLHRHDGDVQVLRQGPLGGQPLPGRQGAVQDVPPDAAVQVFIQRRSAAVFQGVGHAWASSI